MLNFSFLVAAALAQASPAPQPALIGASILAKAPLVMQQLGLGPCERKPGAALTIVGSKPVWFQCQRGVELLVSVSELRKAGWTVDGLTLTFGPEATRGLSQANARSATQALENLFRSELSLQCTVSNSLRQCTTALPLPVHQWTLRTPDLSKHPVDASDPKARTSLALLLQPD